jgi:hypothetical protein
MVTDKDKLLVEATKSHRERLDAAYVFGKFEERRKVQNNRGRLIGSIVLGAVACIGCFGTAFVLNILADQKETKAIESFRSAIASNPLEPGDDYIDKPDSDYLIDRNTGDTIDPETGFVVDEKTGIATDPQGHKIDTRIGWYVDLKTGYYTDPESDVTIDPRTLKPVRD